MVDMPFMVDLPDGRLLQADMIGAPDADPILVLHGSPGAYPIRSTMAQTLVGAGFRAISYSRPGYGASSPHPGRTIGDVAGDSAALLTHLRIERAYVMGGSAGGPAALAVAALCPDRVRAVSVSASLAPYDAPGLDWFAGMDDSEEVRNDRLEAEQGAEVARPAIEALARRMVDEGPAAMMDDDAAATIPPTVMAELWEVIRVAFQTSAEGWVEDTVSFHQPWGFDPATIVVPTAIWHGLADTMVPPTHGQWLAERMPRATTHWLPKIGHLVTASHLPQILDELRQLG